MTPPTILDAIDLATRAAYYDRVWLEGGYYERQALEASSALGGLASQALDLCILGLDKRYYAPHYALTPDEIRRRGEWVETRVERGLLLADNLVEKVIDNAVGDVLDRIERRAGCTPEHDSPRGYLPNICCDRCGSTAILRWVTGETLCDLCATAEHQTASQVGR